MKRFYLVRDEDETGISGTGVVAVGVQFPGGRCAMSWQTQHTSVAVYDSIEDVQAIHGHGGKTRVVWVDQHEPVCDRDTARDFAGSPIAAGDLVMPLSLHGGETAPLTVDRVEQRDGEWWVSAIGWPECGYGLGAERAERLRVVRMAVTT